MRTIPIAAMAGLLAACGSSDAADDAPGPGGAVEVVDSLPLNLGFYVRDDATCASASNATLLLLRKGGLNGSREPCDFKRIERLSETLYRVTQSCNDNGSAWGREDTIYESTSTVEVLGPDRYRLAWEEGGEGQVMTHCPQQDLPEPWRDNDIGDLLES